MTASLRGVVHAAVTGAGASVGLLQSYALPFAWNIGPAGRWWEPVRRRAGTLVGRLFDERAGPRPITDGEYAGSVSMSLEAFEDLLWDEGFVRNVFARPKVRDGHHEIGSWVHRESPLARRQLHLMLFAREGGGVDVYAHEEASSVHPLAATAHFEATEQDVRAGVIEARERLPLATDDAAVDPVAGPWTAQTDRDE